MTDKNALGHTLEGVRRQAQLHVREVTGCQLIISMDDVVNHWRCCLDGEQAAEDWLKQEGLEDLVD